VLSRLKSHHSSFQGESQDAIRVRHLSALKWRESALGLLVRDFWESSLSVHILDELLESEKPKPSIHLRAFGSCQQPDLMAACGHLVHPCRGLSGPCRGKLKCFPSDSPIQINGIEPLIALELVRETARSMEAQFAPSKQIWPDLPGYWVRESWRRTIAATDHRLWTAPDRKSAYQVAWHR